MPALTVENVGGDANASAAAPGSADAVGHVGMMRRTTRRTTRRWTRPTLNSRVRTGRTLTRNGWESVAEGAGVRRARMCRAVSAAVTRRADARTCVEQCVRVDGATGPDVSYAAGRSVTARESDGRCPHDGRDHWPPGRQPDVHYRPPWCRHDAKKANARTAAGREN
jgi:hypothetical protein